MNALNSLNFRHLLAFWTVAREGGLVPAGKKLGVSHPTLSAQVHALEETLGAPLFAKQGRKLVLTDTGKVVQGYADDIFLLGTELVDAVQGRVTGKLRLFKVGIADVVPKLLVRSLLSPALRLPERMRLCCYEASHEALLAQLATHDLDVVISDAPVAPGGPIRAHHQVLQESEVTWFGTRSLVARHRAGFPASLDGAPVLLPLPQLPLRRALTQWFERHDLKPDVVAEFEDSALLKAFGRDGVGLFAAPTVATRDVCSTYGVAPLGTAEGVTERLYLISMERRLKHPAVLAMISTR